MIDHMLEQIVQIEGLAPVTTLPEEAAEGWGENVLATGKASVGKTTQILTLPGKKLIYVFDPNCLQSLFPHMSGQDISILKFIPDIGEVDISIKTLSKAIFDESGRKKKIEPRMYVEFEKDFTDRHASGFFDQFDWVCFDGITPLGAMIMDRVQYRNNRLGKHPEQGDYTAQMNTLLHLFRAITAGKYNTYTSAHIEVRRDEYTGKSEGQLLITGRLRTRLPALFTQIFGMDSDASKDEGVYTAQTVQDRNFPACRTNIQGVKVVEDIRIDFSKDPIGQGIGGILQKATRHTGKAGE